MYIKCTVCRHKDLEEINKLLLRGIVSHRAIGRKYGLSKDALSRHWTNHIAADMKLQRRVSSGESIAAYVDDLRTAAQTILTINMAKGNHRISLAAIRELSRIVETMAKIYGTINEGTQVIVEDNSNLLVLDEGFRAFLTKLLTLQQKQELAQWTLTHK